jgi:hypothetical protein
VEAIHAAALSDPEQPRQNRLASPADGATPIGTTPGSEGIWRIDWDAIKGNDDRQPGG